ncbi:MAG: sialate O-acetylesterase [Clostridia bacterium]|nr:sialate O-acetylesterase [Clostridia bacterium]
MIHSFLLIGQSNMAGRGYIKEAVPVNSENIKVLRNGRWQPMYRPVNCDRAFSGVSLAESFAEKYAEEHSVTVGLIPCADGGTSLDHWAEGEALFENAVYMSKLAMRSSTIAGVLWHQGESDCKDGLWQQYEGKAKNIFLRLREILNLQDVPFIIGGLGDYLSIRGEELNEPLYFNYRYVNEALQRLAKNDKMIGFASAEGLTANADNLHFNSASLYEFGLRYYEVFKTLEDKSKVFTEKGNNYDVAFSKIEKL